MEKPLCTLPDGGCLIETFGWTPETGVIRQALHLARLERSATALRVSYDRQAVLELIASIAADSSLRCRLTVASNGDLDLTTAEMPALASIWNVVVSDDRLNSGDPFLFHKSSQRKLYDETRHNMPEQADEVIFLNERGEVCEGTITNVIAKIDGIWRTPPISSGCLPGVYRQSLLDNGRVTESVLTLDDLKTADEIRLCNSLRAEVRARLVT